MKILAIETSGKTFSAALNENSVTIASCYYECEHIHSEIIIPAVERLLKDTNISIKSIDKFAVSTGPGSFTGIRIGMTAIKTFAQILNSPITTVDSLTILENSVAEQKDVKIVAAIDALRNEVYVKQKNEIIIKNIDLLIKDLKKHKNKILVIGNASDIYKEKFVKSFGEYSVSLPRIMNMPKAEVLASLACNLPTLNYTDIKPLYIRRLWVEGIKKSRKPYFQSILL
ncbi:MAG: tRNA (adenosine(37)-N6)-threonylcarbamoyltransferase complex dimerization subunit type 1 TsaB [Endomicrobium sp.]|jgi:tRNA threonylcarbamoyl adenosine modification protein YeaZ|nr:tRNA (adenosine(37)-N6)-threonylcarbamoyltransferase complex dimerization subunit type 1 TsaB [Endomicrobium sp.]